jgi:hypothetical protein
VLKEEVECSLCKQNVDVLGDHAACCAKTSDLVHRHNRLRNLIDKMCTEGNLSPVMEKKGILGDTPGRRPGDVSVPLWADNKGLAIDVAVTSPFASHNISVENPCEKYAATRKHKKYDASFVGSNYDFVAVVFETTGGLNEQGLLVLRQVFRFAAKQENTQLSVYVVGPGHVYLATCSLRFRKLFLIELRGPQWSVKRNNQVILTLLTLMNCVTFNFLCFSAYGPSFV